MAGTEVVVADTRSLGKAFLELPWRLYQDDPNWVPPLRGRQKEVTGYVKDPFFEVASRKPFVALRNGKPVGRLLALVNPVHNERYKEKRGFVGFFESENDPEISSALFSAAADWLREQGMDAMRGPCNPSLNYEIGLLIEGFDEPPTFLMTYNPPWYETLWDSFGWKKTQDLYAYYGHVDMLGSLNKKMEFVATESIRRFNIKLRRMEPRRFEEDVRTFLNLYNVSLQGTWGFTPMSDAEVTASAKGLKRLLVPEMTSIAEVDGKPIGAALGILDFNPVIKKIDGRLFPFGFVRLLTSKRKIKRVRIVSANVTPEYQRWGIGLALMARLLPDVLGYGAIEEGEFSWVLESNRQSRGALEGGGAKRTKTYRLYDYDLNSAIQG